MNDVNNCTVSGRLIKEPEVRKTPTGTVVCDLYLATNKYKKIKGIKQQFTTIIPVTLWNRTAEHWGTKLGTSDHIFVTGELVDDNFESLDQEGNLKYRTNGRLKMDNAEITLLNNKQIKKAYSINNIPTV